MDITLAERSLFSSTYPNFKRSIAHESILRGAISSLYITAQEIIAQIADFTAHSSPPNSAIFLMDIVVAFQNTVLGGK